MKGVCRGDTGDDAQQRKLSRMSVCRRTGSANRDRLREVSLGQRVRVKVLRQGRRSWKRLRIKTGYTVSRRQG